VTRPPAHLLTLGRLAVHITGATGSPRLLLQLTLRVCVPPPHSVLHAPNSPATQS
jgi:hypothetical protein